MNQKTTTDFSVQNAIELQAAFATATSGDRIIVAPGTYTLGGTLQIPPGVVIEGMKD